MHRLTPRRQAVLDVLQAAPDHPTASQVFDRVRERQPGIGAATVYRALSLLVADGQARLVALGDGAPSRYDANLGRHDHVVCTRCGTAADVDARLPAEAVARVAARSRYDVHEYELQFRGLCPACRHDHANDERGRHVRARQ